MSNGFWADVTVLLLVGSIRTLFMSVAHETVVDAATAVRAFEVEVLLAVLNFALYIRQVWTVCLFVAPCCQ